MIFQITAIHFKRHRRAGRAAAKFHPEFKNAYEIESDVSEFLRNVVEAIQQIIAGRAEKHHKSVFGQRTRIYQQRESNFAAKRTQNKQIYSGKKKSSRGLF